jgi:phosphatidylserine/phosphatidylglycerophosphate/cardiolipin synthase-like enzyme
MAKKNNKSGGRSLAGTLLGIILIVGAFILTQVTGIDFVAILEDFTGEPVPITQPDTTDGTSVEIPPAAPESVTMLTVGQGFGGQKGFWTVYFNAPTGESDESFYVNGIDEPLAAAIGEVQATLDIAAFEFDNEVLTQAVLDAHERGVTVRIVTDDEHGLEEEDESIPLFIEEGIPVVDDSRSGLMHNKFMIMDNTTVWTGSMNYTRNGVYRNNNHLLALRSQRAVQAYQTEFDEMFIRSEFGTTSTEGTAEYTQDGTPVEILFASEDDVVGAITDEIALAEDRIRFMAFSFTHDEIGEAMMQAAANGITLEGIFELRGSQTEFSELGRMFCSGNDVRQDGNGYVLHHKVILIDDHTVLTGSFNFSNNATTSNDENLLIIKDPDLLALFLTEYERRWAEAASPTPDRISCD